MNNEKEPGIEVLMARLEEITSQMEKETLPLAEMMELYKEGRALEKKIKKMLDLTEKEIEVLGADDLTDNGEEP